MTEPKSSDQLALESSEAEMDLPEEIASMLHVECSCVPRNNGGGECDWCQAYYGFDNPTETEKAARLLTFRIYSHCHGPSLDGEWFDQHKALPIIQRAIEDAVAEAELQVEYERDRNENNILCYSAQEKELKAQLAVAREALEKIDKVWQGYKPGESLQVAREALAKLKGGE